MPDYQLERLNTRSFEQLTQALAVKFLGPNVGVFGDGADGGREALFEGTVHCPPTRKPWNGFGLLQAKFRQHPDSEPKKNADWAIQQLKEEFKSLQPRSKSRRASASAGRKCPDYYIFATNVTLSAVARTGGKDRVRALLDGYKKSHGLKDFAIWDGDQIRAFLDAAPEIRTTYSAWLLPGDVLGAIMRVLQLERADFLSTLRRLLECELLDDQFARLGQGGYSDEKTIPLSSVFLDLPVKSDPGDIDPLSDLAESPSRGARSQRPTFLALLLEEGRQVLKPSLGTKITRFTGQDQPGRMVLVGGPGQGKTTVGQYACQLLRAALLRAAGEPFSPEVRQALEHIEALSADQPVVSARRYPLRVDLKQFAAALAAPGAEGIKGLFDYLLKRIADRTNSRIHPEEFRRWLGGYPWLLVLDGLDEVPASSNRQQVMQAIRDFVSVEAHHADADMLVLATTRPQGYSQEFQPSLYRHLTLEPLAAETALLYGSRLAAARHPGQQQRIEELTRMLAKASANPATAHLMQSPLQVTIMLALIEGGGEPPEQRWKLFHDYYDVIYRREKERDTPFSGILRRYEPEIHWIHHRAGWLLQQRNAASGTTSARLTHDKFDQMVDSRLKSRGHDDEVQRTALVRQIRLAATDRLVLLVGNTAAEIGFEIRSLQEFMASECFFDGGDACVHHSLHAIAPFPYWLNGFLLASGRVFFEREILIDNLIAICDRLNEAPDDPAHRAIRSGSRLAAALLKDGAARNQPASIRVIASCAARCMDVHDDDYSEVLAELFWGEAESVLKEELLQRLDRDPEEVPSHIWLVCLHLAIAGKPWAVEWMEQRFPWTRNRVDTVIAYMLSHPDLLPERLLRVLADTSVYRPLRETRVNMRGSGFDGSLLEKLEEFSQWDKKVEWPLRLDEHGSRSIGVAFGIDCLNSLSPWAQFEYPQADPRTFHPEWQVACATSRFARTPSRASLVQELYAISQIRLDAMDPYAIRSFPWQISACLDAHQNGRAWSDIIASVEAGALGDREDWERWERHGRSGVRLSQFRFAPEWGVRDDFLGLILRFSDWGIAQEPTDFGVGDAVAAAWDRWPDLREAVTLRRVSCRMVLQGVFHHDISGKGVIRRFVASGIRNKVPMPTTVIVAALIERCPIEEKLRTVADLGAYYAESTCVDRSHRDGGIPRGEVGAILQLAHQPMSLRDAASVFYALSLLPPLEGFAGVPQPYRHYMESLGPKYAWATTALQLNSLEWPAEQSAELAKRAIGQQADNPDFLATLLLFIEHRSVTGPHLEAFLLELLTRIPRNSDTGLRSQVTRLLVRLVERRPTTTQLPDPAAAKSLPAAMVYG